MATISVHTLPDYARHHVDVLRAYLARSIPPTGGELRARAVATEALMSDEEAIQFLLHLQSRGTCVVYREWEALGADGHWHVIEVSRYRDGMPRLGWWSQLDRELGEDELEYSVIAAFSEPIELAE